MQKFTRHSFLGVAAAVGAGTVDFFYPGAGQARITTGTRGRTEGATLQESQGPDPTFACGTVRSITDEGVVLEAGGVVRAVRIDASARVWKEFDVDRSAIEIGNWLDVKGTPFADGSLGATSGQVFVNIGRRDGIVRETHSDRVVVENARGELRPIEFSSRLEVIDGRDESPLPGHVKALTRGTAIGSVGIRLPGSRYRATRIWLAGS